MAEEKPKQRRDGGPVPTTDDEWTVHALNVQGTFFERKCIEVVRAATGWKLVNANLPTEYRGHASELDIHARYAHQPGATNLFIECKKANPEYSSWIFLRHHDASVAPRFRSVGIKRPSPLIWEAQLDIFRLKPGAPLPIASDGRETKGSYGGPAIKGFTKTSNTSIHDAARQVILALHGRIGELLGALGGAKANRGVAPNLEFQEFVPVIATTARLQIARFDAADVDLATGEIPWAKVQLEDAPWLVYEYPVPVEIQLIHGEDAVDPRAYIIVVQSLQLPKMLAELRGWL